MAWPWQLCLVLMVSIFLPLLVTHTCTGADTDATDITQTTSMPPIATPPPPTNISQKPIIRVGITMPDVRLRKRAFLNKIRAAIRPFDNMLGDKYEFSYESFIQSMMPRNASTSDMTEALCDTFLPANVSAIIFVTDNETFGRNTSASLHFLQLAGKLGIPVIAWNPDNSGLEQASMSGLHIQMAPSIHNQAAAMLSILVQYEWLAFTIVTSTIAGHTDFVQSIRDQVDQYGDPQDTSKPNINFTIIDSVLVTNTEEDLQKIKGGPSEASSRIFLLYSTREEADSIMQMAQAEEMQLTGKNIVWIVTQSVIGSHPDNAPNDFPVGMLGVHFETDEAAHMRAIQAAIRVFAYGVKNFLEDPSNDQFSLLDADLSCEPEGNNTAQPWTVGSRFYSVLKNLSIRYDQICDDKSAGEVGRTKTLEFLSDGTRKDVKLKIMNLRKHKTTLRANTWEEIGTWSSLVPDKMHINGIVWPGDQDMGPPPPTTQEKLNTKKNTINVLMTSVRTWKGSVLSTKKDNEENIEMSATITGRIVVQQCLNASLTLPGDTELPEVIDIGRGMVVSIGFLNKASEETVNKLVKQITNVRLSGDGTGKRCSVLDVQGDILIVPQPTLGGKLKDEAMKYNMNVENTLGEELYNNLCQEVRTVVEESSTSGNVTCGVYGARQVLKMDTNGPFTHIIEV